jgi:hypothetical protein
MVAFGAADALIPARRSLRFAMDFGITQRSR